MKNRKLLLSATRKVIYCLLIIAAFIMQFTIIPKTELSLPVILLIPVIIPVAMNEKEFSGMLFGLLTGALWDLASPLTDGLLTLIFALTGFATGFLTHYFLRNTLLTSILFNLIAETFYFATDYIGIAKSVSIELLPEIIKKNCILPMIISLAVSIPAYFFILFVHKKTKHSDKTALLYE